MCDVMDCVFFFPPFFAFEWPHCWRGVLLEWHWSVLWPVAHLFASLKYVAIIYVQCSKSLLHLLTYGLVAWNAYGQYGMFKLQRKQSNKLIMMVLCVMSSLTRIYDTEYQRSLLLPWYVNGCTIIYRLLESMNKWWFFFCLASPLLS